MQFRSDMTVALIECSASDNGVARAARVSTLGFDSLHQDRSPKGLINFLMRDRHGSPFEHNSFTFLIETPIFVAREFMRHRAGWSYNEESGRYRELRPIFYIPGPGRELVQVGKPGAYEFEPGTELQHEIADAHMLHAYEEAYERYRAMLHHGIAREVARAVLPVGIYTSFYATCNARSLMHFLSLRTKHADARFPSFPQCEIEMVARGMEEAFSEAMPLTHSLFTEHGRVAP